MLQNFPQPEKCEDDMDGFRPLKVSFPSFSVAETRQKNGAEPPRRKQTSSLQQEGGKMQERREE